MQNFAASLAAIVSVCALAACSQGEDGTTIERRHPRTDAAVVQADAPSATGTVTCYTEGDPAQSCGLPVHCCFSSYSSQHDGYCTTSTCAYGTIDCDGPEDCASGEHCCSHALFSTDGSLSGYAIGCQASACGAAPRNYELCHSGGSACSNGGSCVTAYGNDNDLPRTLAICQ